MKQKIILQQAIVNRYTILSATILWLLLCISWVFESDILAYLFHFSNDYPEAFRKDIQFNFIIESLTWESFISASMYHLVLIFVLFPTFMTLPFLKEKNSYFILGRNRFTSLTKAYYTSIIKYACIAAIVMVSVFVVYITLGGLFLTNALDDIGGVTAIFPDGFYNKYPYFVFLFIVVVIYGAVAFVFSLLASGIMLWINKGYIVVFIMMILYQSYVELGVKTGNKYFEIVEMVVAYNTVTPTLQLFYPLLPIIVLAMILIIFGVKRNVKGYQT